MSLLVEVISAEIEVELLAASTSAEELTEDIIEVLSSKVLKPSAILLPLILSLLVLIDTFSSLLVIDTSFLLVT